MKFLVDEHLPHLVVRVLRARGLEAVHVDDIGLDGRDDTAIWTEAVRTGAIVVSKDSDFAARLRGRPPHAPVLWLQCGNIPNARLKALLEAALPEILAWVAGGARLVEALHPRR